MGERTREVNQGRNHRIETFDPLLRDLASWGLVERDPAAAEPTWVLSPEAQRRLDELVRPAEPVSVEQLVYLDHSCADCHGRRPTRLRQGLYLCDACSERRLSVSATPADLPPPPAGARGLRRLRHRPDTEATSSGVA